MGVKIDEVIEGEWLDYTLGQGAEFGPEIKVVYSDMTGTAFIKKGEDFIYFTQDQMQELAEILKALL